MPTNPIFALIVGIDQYPNPAHNLKGAVNDAKSFEKFLRDETNGGLGVPKANIERLYNEEATHDTILSKFRTHLDNAKINRDENPAMIFFFAGHGCRTYAKKYPLSSDYHYEAIRAYDHPIPDYILAQNLRELAFKNKNNITVILDSCYSGGMGRNEEDGKDGPTVRGSPPQPMHDDDIRTVTTGSRTPSTDMTHDLWTFPWSSHNLLAACSQFDKAYETDSEPFFGHFTQKLVHALRETVGAGKDTTYVELMDRLGKLENNQKPRCWGVYTDRVVFTSNPPVPGTRTLCLKKVHILKARVDPKSRVRPGMSFSVDSATLTAEIVTKDFIVLVSPVCLELNTSEAQYTSDKFQHFTIALKESSTSPAFLVQTGRLAGVHEGMQFPLHVSQAQGIPILVAQIVGIGQTILVLHHGMLDDIPVDSRVTVQDWAEKVLIYAPQFVDKRCRRTESRETADIAASMEGDKIMLERLKGTSVEYGTSKTSFSPDGLHLPSGESGDRQVDSENLVKPIWAKKNVYQVDVSEGVMYGLTICNNTSGKLDNNNKDFGTGQPLFPYIFYFHPVEYTIKNWHIPEGARDEPPLDRGKELNVGMGGEPAFYFTLPQNTLPPTTLSTEFIKLFVATESLDLNWIEQSKSPLSTDFKDIMGGRDGHQEILPRSSDWATVEVVVNVHASAVKK
ncbi:caspase domain-containing protein [Mycena leptocephala]|nr:caspase domain-containing protein [Mycena leptocephala]